MDREPKDIGFLILLIALAVTVFGVVIPLWVMTLFIDLHPAIFNLIALGWVIIAIGLTLFFTTKPKREDGK